MDAAPVDSVMATTAAPRAVEVVGLGSHTTRAEVCKDSGIRVEVADPGYPDLTVHTSGQLA